VKSSSQFPVETHAVIDGVDLQNANGESCGGSFANSFAQSCNSVFAPLGVKLGGKRLVAAAEKFGFNEPPSVPGEAASTLPSAADIGSPLAVGSSAIGQGKVLATPLEMAVVADTIASHGVRHRPTLLEHGGVTRGIRVTSKRIARAVEKLMIGVVQHGTGTAASLAPVVVAGKTGTAELQSTVGPTGTEPPVDTDAWFAAYAPTRRPRLAVGVLFVKAGAGGTVAAPAARIVLQAGLSAKR
jgi:cell division protein FtsI/penicillin-binding protein 2